MSGRRHGPSRPLGSLPPVSFLDSTEDEPVTSLTAPAPLGTTVAQLRSGSLSLIQHVHDLCDRIAVAEPQVRALLPEPNRRDRLVGEAEELLKRFPDPAGRPPLFGATVGVKDIFNVDGFETRGGSALPAKLFAGPEAVSVRRLRDAGALIMGKTVSTEFAYFGPTATTNPHNPKRSPGSSSSGSAAAVAAGFVLLALGTQTVGSTVRPASYCGVVGYKPSFGRIPTEGVIACAESLDHVGSITQDSAGAALVASVLCDDWAAASAGPADGRLPTLAVPVGPYLEQAEPEARRVFEEQLARLEARGCALRRVPALPDTEEIAERHFTLMAAEFARVHAEWFRDYGSLYRSHAAALIETGRGVTQEQLAAARAGTTRLRSELERLMSEHGIDAWVCPTTTDPAPEFLAATGNPGMNLPWTHAGLPAVTVPAGASSAGLPLGLQIVGRYGADESVLGWAQALERALSAA